MEWALIVGLDASQSVADVAFQLWNTRHHPEDVKKGLQESLDRLQLQHIDLYLMHWPIAFKVCFTV